MSPSGITNKLWNYCNVLRDDGMSYGDYVEQLTYLLFLKMSDERTQAPYYQPSIVPQQYSWSSLIKKGGDELFDQLSGSRYPALARKPSPWLLPRAFGGIEVHWTSVMFRFTHQVLDALGKEKGLLGLILNKAQNKFDSAHPWASAFGRAARAQFRSRRNCQAMVDVMAPEPGETIADPACGTGGFLLAAHRYLIDNYPNMTKPQKKALKAETFKGWELVQNTARLCAMNMLLHGIGNVEAASRRLGMNDKRQDAASTLVVYRRSEKKSKRQDAASTVPILVGDSLADDPGDRFDLILANPPFGKKSGTTIVGEGGKVSKERDTVERDDFWATTSNKQLNFVQHIKTLLKINGRAAVVVPDNVLFEGGAGETIRRKLLHECDVHTLLRSTSLRIPCSARRPRAHHPWRARSRGRRFTGPSPNPAHPTGLFYAQGVKANVLFFDKKPASETPWTRELWIYDLRTNMHFTLKINPLKREDLDDFVKCYILGAPHLRAPSWNEENPTGRWRAYGCEEIINRDKASLDIFWLKDESLEDSDNMPEPGVLAAEIVEDLQVALEQFREIAADLNGGAAEDAAG